MTKPNSFRHIHILSSEASYTHADTASEGTLYAGRVLYVEAATTPRSESVRAYAEGIGLISVRSEALFASPARLRPVAVGAIPLSA